MGYASNVNLEVQVYADAVAARLSRDDAPERTRMPTSPLHNAVEEIVSLAQAAALLHSAGCEPGRVVAQLRPRLGELDDVAWAAAEDELAANGVDRSVVRALARQRGESSGHPQVVAELGSILDLPQGHPIDTLFRENDAIRRLAAELSGATDLPSAGDSRSTTLREHLRRLAQALSETRKHQDRVQNVMLPYLERRGLKGLTRRLWAYYGGVRSRLAALQALLDRAPPDPALRTALEPIVPALIKSLHLSMAREEQVVAPLLLRLLTEREWADVWRDSLSCGACLVEPGHEYAPTDPSQDVAEEHVTETAGRVRFRAGELSHEQLRGIFTALPFDLTFVDEKDAVQFFTESAHRIFPRNLSVLGRNVQNCHPPSSIRLVNRILSDFREGRRDVAEFWFNRRGQFVYVRYFAVRDRTGTYLGTLEVAQDLTPLRTLQDEQRRLTDDSAEPPTVRRES